MSKYLRSLVIIVLASVSPSLADAQSKPAQTPSPEPTRPTQVQQRPAASFNLSEYGVEVQPDPRLIIMMSALEAAGFDPTPAGQEPSVFRAQVRKDLANLDPDLRQRLRTFYERNKLPAPATAADQAARYVSLAFAFGAGPSFDAPERSDDLPGGLLEVLDFAPLVREFYRKSGIDERLVAYTRAHQAEVIACANRLRTSCARSFLTSTLDPSP